MQHVSASPPVVTFNAAVQGCVFPDGVTQTRHRNAVGNTAVFDAHSCHSSLQEQIIQRFRPSIIFWVIDNPANEVFVKGKWIDTCSEAYARLYERALRDEITALRAHGAKVVVTTEVYPRYLFARADAPTDCDNAIRRRVVAETGTEFVDLNNYICPGGHCRKTVNGVVLRDDGEHYDGAGGRLVSRWLLDHVS
jgi:hypothetical protein